MAYRYHGLVCPYCKTNLGEVCFYEMREPGVLQSEDGGKIECSDCHEIVDVLISYTFNMRVTALTQKEAIFFEEKL